jgi:hypothetical protein
MTKFKRGDLVTFDKKRISRQDQQWFYHKTAELVDTNNTKLRSEMVGLVGEVLSIDSYNSCVVWWPQLPGYNKEHCSYFELYASHNK